MNISWKILKLECISNQNGLENVIFHVYFEYIGEQTINNILYSASLFEVIAIEEPDVNNFTPLDEVTKEQVISWIENKIDIFALNTRLNILIERQIKPSIIEIELPFGD